MLIEKLPEIHDPADRGFGGGRHFDQVEALLARQTQCFFDQENSDLRAVPVDDANLAGADAFVGARAFVDTQLTPRERRVVPVQTREGRHAAAWKPAQKE